MIVLVRTLILYALVILVMRLMGKRQIGQLQPFELAITIMISELAAVPMQNTGIPLIHGIIPILTLLLAQISISYAATKSRKFENFLCGKPAILIEKGKINEENLKQELYTLSDLMEQLRLKNIPSLSDVEFAILETNGDLSVLPKTGKKAPNLSDLNIAATYEGLSLPVILDGNVIDENLRKLNMSHERLAILLQQQAIDSPQEILFASLDDAGNFHIQHKTPSKGIHIV